jgi:hypothetical protein
LTGWSGVALDVHDLGLGILRPVAEAVHDEAAAHRAVRAGVACLGRPFELEGPHRRSERLLAVGEAERTQRRPAKYRTGSLQEGAA